MKKNVKISVVKEFYKRKSFVKNQVDLIRQVIEKYRISTKENILLFSAHGLPLSIIAKGDPYQRQIEENVEMIVKELNIIALQYKTCYQSRVGLKKWLSPTTEDEIRRAGSCGLGIIVVPISFVSEHSETMVELDIDYKKMAKTCKVPRFYRIPTQGNDQGFVKLLAELSLDKNRSN